MAHFAELDENNIVKRVIVADNVQWCIDNLGGRWVETFKNNPNKNYAGKGYIYYADKDNFSTKQPFTSWKMDKDCKWKPPKAKPSNTSKWNEDILDWEEIII